MVSNNSPYMERVLIQLGTLHIREAISCATDTEINKLATAWKTANFPPLEKNLKVTKPEFDLNQVKGHVRLTKKCHHCPFSNYTRPRID